MTDRSESIKSGDLVWKAGDMGYNGMCMLCAFWNFMGKIMGKSWDNCGIVTIHCGYIMDTAINQPHDSMMCLKKGIPPIHNNFQTKMVIR